MAEQASIVAELIVDAAVRAAIISNDRAELTTLLETRSSDGGLYLAADLNRADCIAALLPYTTGSAIDKPAKYSTTPLHVASSKGHAECVQLLLAADQRWQDAAACRLLLRPDRLRTSIAWRPRLRRPA